MNRNTTLRVGDAFKRRQRADEDDQNAPEDPYGFFHRNKPFSGLFALSKCDPSLPS
jgi:hypothetical protein